MFIMKSSIFETHSNDHKSSPASTGTLSLLKLGDGQAFVER